MGLKVRDGKDGITGDDVDSFSSKYKFRWKIEGETLEMMKKAYPGKYFQSNGFKGNLWNLRCAPNGENEADKGKVMLWLQLNAFPMGVSSMAVEFELKCTETNTRALMKHKYSVNKPVAGWT